ncbi:uncharacterized protein F4812DRAFT_419795 [Daldinia caldariorum]|uniref:uncharacterized protein n=1 Tax=Daldinia caldariorum TaxID=326644 RepID=UPI0020080B88|nr:uncharacterized protein F4812DRAFT_419795 [Daldinia caldariorum]KAI1469637.1 hypothetical protein F4812DRAFT_419795 [Daldinia caldariorum]
MSVTFTTVQDQSQSPFFSRFPGEIRNAIYEYCRINASATYLCNGPLRSQRIASALSNLTSLHKTCKRIYNEVYEMLYASHLQLTSILDSSLRQGHVQMVSDGLFNPSRLRSLDISYTHGDGFSHNLCFCFWWLSYNAPNIRQIRVRINQSHSVTWTQRISLLALFNMIIPGFVALTQLELIELDVPLTIDVVQLLHTTLVSKSVTEQVKLCKVIACQHPGEPITYRTVLLEASDLEIPEEEKMLHAMANSHSDVAQLIHCGVMRVMVKEKEEAEQQATEQPTSGH